MQYRFVLGALVLVFGLLGYTPAAAQTATPPVATPATGAAATPVAAPTTVDAQAVLKRADDVASLAKEAAEQNTATINTVQSLATLFGLISAVAFGALALIGFESRRGFRELRDEYRAQLTEMRAEYQASLKAYQAERANVQALRQEIDQKRQEITAYQQELRAFRQEVAQEFADARQVLVLVGLGNRSFSDGKYDEAIDAYEQARRIQPNDPATNYHLGRAYSNTGRYTDAFQRLKDALKARPDFAEASMELGLAYRRQADQSTTPEDRAVGYKQAEDYLKQAIALRPDYEDALGTLGGLYRRARRYPEALQYYGRAAIVDPNSSYALNNIASLQWYQGEIDKARYHFERVAEVASSRILIGREPIYWDLYDRALARLVLGQQTDALADLQRALALTPHTENLRSVLDNLRFLAQAPTPIAGLDEFIRLVAAKMQAG